MWRVNSVEAKADVISCHVEVSQHEGDFWCGDDIINKDGYALCKTSLSLRTLILRYLRTLSLAAKRNISDLLPIRSNMRTEILRFAQNDIRDARRMFFAKDAN